MRVVVLLSDEMLEAVRNAVPYETAKGRRT